MSDRANRGARARIDVQVELVPNETVAPARHAQIGHAQVADVPDAPTLAERVGPEGLAHADAVGGVEVGVRVLGNLKMKAIRVRKRGPSTAS